MKHRGSATVEATLVMPIFIFAMLALYHMSMCKIAEIQIYEMATECSEYVAEQGYVKEECVVTPEVVMHKYMDDKKLISKYVVGGMNGISFIGSEIDSEHMLKLKVTYFIRINIPLISKLRAKRTFEVRQRCYVGYDRIYLGDTEENDLYVYITENRDVYHMSRSCTHLKLSKKLIAADTAKRNKYKPCEFCAKGKRVALFVIVTDTGGKYHLNDECSGLKRTVKRVKLSSVPELGGCKRCSN